MWQSTADPDRFDEALEWFERRVPALAQWLREFRFTSATRAFLVAGVTDLDVVAAIWTLVGDTLRKGDGLDEFKRRARAEIARWRVSGDRLETVYRTNVQTAYNRGRFRQMGRPEVTRHRPFWLYDAVLDSKTSDTCRPLNGTVLPREHRFWSSHHPPLHHRCRSALRALTPRQAKRRGITTADDLPDVDVGEGFGGLPNLYEWQPDPSKYPPDLWRIHQRRMRRGP